MTQAILEVDRLSKVFSVPHGLVARAAVRAVDDVSFSIAPGQTLAIVGESGSGKTTVSKLILGLEQPTSGQIRFEGHDIQNMDRAAHKHYRRQVQAVFQNPYESLNPRLRVRTIIGEPVMAHERVSAAELDKRVAQALEVVGLPASAAQLFPHEFSGGQRQRIAIARALVLRPRLLVLDEPISALDVSIRAQILNMLADVQEEFGLTYLLIAHDLSLVEHFSNQVAVMYLGSLVEAGPVAQVFSAPRHPYTQALLASVPRPDPDHRPPKGVIIGEISSALATPAGCRFHPRCPHAFAPCKTTQPALGKAGDHAWACHLPQG